MLFQESLDAIVELFSRVKKDDWNGVIQDLLTPAEIVELSERINILKKLNIGQKQREISDKLGISVTTVSRGNRVIKFGTGSIKKYL